MKKIIAYLWLPISAMVILAFIYGGLTLEDLKTKNQKLEQKQITLEEKMGSLELEGEVSKTEIALSQEKIENLVSAPKGILGTAAERNQNEKVETITNTVTNYLATPVKNQASVIIDGVGSYKVDIALNDTAFSILLKAARQNDFSVQSTIYEGLGAFITSIAGITPSGNQYWAFYYNGKYSMKGASAQKISKDDSTFWRLESF